MKKTLIYFSLLFRLMRILQCKDLEDSSDTKDEQVVVRAVFINCELGEEQNLNEVAANRFQRDELYKHSALQGCHKKLALTVKIASEPDVSIKTLFEALTLNYNKSSGDEYIPIEHVFDGSSNKRRARLLDPYILRLRRDTPLQAYKLRRIDTITGILPKYSDRRSRKPKKSRVQRNLDKPSEQDDDWTNSKESSSTTKIFESTEDFNPCGAAGINATTNLSSPINEDQNEFKVNARVKRDSCTLANNPAWKRDKRHEHNIIVEDIIDDYTIPWGVKNRFYRRLEHPTENRKVSTDELSNEGHDGDFLTKNKAEKLEQSQREVHRTDSNQLPSKHNINFADSAKDNTNKDQTMGVKEFTNRRSIDKKSTDTYFPSSEMAEKNFVLYDIGNPDLWYTVQVQLFEKTSTPEGKTVWNDITKGEVARVSTFQPEWFDQDLNVRYKPTEWISKDEFALPSATNLCLLAPLHNNDGSTNLDYNGKYIVVPKDDIVTLEDTEGLLIKRDGNYTHATASGSSTQEQQGHRKVLVRVSRALLTESEDELKISTVGTDRFLTFPHRRPHQAQIDVEARADENQLIRVGSSASLITIVSDNSRRTRTVVTVQATNKGLAAARFRVRARDCGPEMASVMSEKSDGITAGPALVPPRHTQRFHLELPTGVPVDTIHCSVALINDDEESVAVRDVEIKKGDRCFCVWHCDCVCLKVDPKLSCREMPEARQTAAGLSTRERARRARSVCYSDCVTVDLFATIVGVLMTLLLLGLVKACMGLFCRCVGTWGLDKLVQAPRKLEHYFEPSLQGRCVVYDEEGWPVHPDTKKRSVRLISKSMEFILNMIIFIILPCLLLRDAVVQLACRTKTRRSGDATALGGDKKCFSTHDMQGSQPRWRRRRGGLRRWMSPQAEGLSTDIWTKGLSTRKSVECEFMLPLLHERRAALSSCADSEQDDTEYVLMQMQKSKESLARSQKKFNEPGIPPTSKQVNPETKVSQTVTR